MVTQFSTAWKSSTQPRKQRKYLYEAPLHSRQKMVHVHLSSELRKKYGHRNTQLRKGDKVKILRGNFAGKEGRVERVLLKQGKVLVAGAEIIRKNGTKVQVPLPPSNLLLLELELSDKKRKAKLESSKAGTGSASKRESKKVEGKK